MFQVPGKETRLWRISSASVIYAIAATSKLVIGLFNKPCVYNKDRLLHYIDQLPKKPLLTVSNHYSMVDDCLLQYIVPWRIIIKRPRLRWVPGAQEICFTSKGSSLFFLLGKVIPVIRGDGVYQPTMNFCVERLSLGEWVHLYPEGQVNMSHEFKRLKWGVGRLIADSEVCPVVLPYWTLGMDDMFPTKKPYHPRIGHKITVLFGEPIDFENDLKKLRNEKRTDEEIRKFLTDKIQDVFLHLKQRTEEKHRLRSGRTTSKSDAV